MHRGLAALLALLLLYRAAAQLSFNGSSAARTPTELTRAAAAAGSVSGLVLVGDALGLVTSSSDACGICAGDNSSCAGCDGVPNSRAVDDACGVCAGDSSSCSGCDGVPYSRAALDLCGVCGGSNACLGCDGVPNSHLVIDACGLCGGNGSTCAGCDGVPNSGKVYDACCYCGGGNSSTSPCYVALVNSALGPPRVFNPNSDNFTDFYTPLGQALYDLCGECSAWGYNSSTCTGCDGVPMSGAVRDSLGVCGGGCSSCTPQPCLSARLAGPAETTTIYPPTPQNRPGLPPWTVQNRLVCYPAIGSVVAGSSLWLVRIYGLAFGPFNTEELLSDAVYFNSPLTGLPVRVPLTADTLVAPVLNVTTLETVQYGVTASDPGRAAAWAAAVSHQGGVVSVPSAPRVINSVTRILWQLSFGQAASIGSSTGDDSGAGGGSAFAPFTSWPTLVGTIYPGCTDVSWRAGSGVRLHGKKSGFNPLGLLVGQLDGANLSGVTNVTNASWNPVSQGIQDVVGGWADLACSCSPDWAYYPTPTPPTCNRTFQQPTWPLPAGSSLTRTAFVTGGSLRFASGGWAGGLDGGGAPLQYLGVSTGGDVGAKATRAPWRLGAQGSVRAANLAPAAGEAASMCRPGLRLVPSAPAQTGGVWAATPMALLSGLTVSLSFQLGAAAQRCESVSAVSSSLGQQVLTLTSSACTPQRGDGLALLLLDAAGGPPVVGGGGYGLGYEGLSGVFVLELDSRGDPGLGEPPGPHITLTASSATAPASPFYAARLAAAAAAGWADGKVHNVTLAYTPGMAAAAAALGSSAFTGGGAASAAALGGGEVGGVTVFIDGVIALAAAIAPASFLLPGIAGEVYVGVTAANGAQGHQAVDVLSLTASVTT